MLGSHFHVSCLISAAPSASRNSLSSAMTVLSVQVFEHQMCSEEAVDAHRFKDIIDSAVADGKARASMPYKAWAARVAKRPPPEDPLAWPPKKSPSAGRPSTADLALAMRRAHCRSFCPSHITAAFRSPHDPSSYIRRCTCLFISV